VPAAAGASAVSADGTKLTLAGAPLEANRVELSVSNGSTLVLRDRGGPLSAGPGCTAVSSAVATCPVSAGRLTIDLGDGADTVLVRSVWHDVTVDGGAGDDVIRLSRGGDETQRNGSVALGGEGNDRIEEADTADGGPGDDVVVVANLSGQTFPSYNLGFPRPGTWYLRFDSDARVYQGDFGDAGYNATADGGPNQGMPASGNVGLGPYSLLVYSQ
jgi:hypothetical protein